MCIGIIYIELKNCIGTQCWQKERLRGAPAPGHTKCIFSKTFIGTFTQDFFLCIYLRFKFKLNTKGTAVKNQALEIILPTMCILNCIIN